MTVFDDYYEKKTKVVDKKEVFSMSGDSYQSEGYIGSKKHVFTPKSIADKVHVKSKNIVTNTLIANQELRGGFKSPNNRMPNRTEGEDSHSTKKILNFGAKKL